MNGLPIVQKYPVGRRFLILPSFWQLVEATMVAQRVAFLLFKVQQHFFDPKKAPLILLFASCLADTVLRKNCASKRNKDAG